MVLVLAGAVRCVTLCFEAKAGNTVVVADLIVGSLKYSIA